MVSVYVIESLENGRRYVGITNDLTRRLREHRSGHTKAGQVLRDLHLLHHEPFPDHAAARKREKFLKSGQGREWLAKRFPRTGLAAGE